MSNAETNGNGEAFLGHPPGLFTLFFAEMWERFSYYGMRALLVFYMIKGFLGYGDSDAYTVYGAYTALVYMTPFFGGMLADRLLGARRAVILGGLLMAAGHLMMTIETEFAFFAALALLIAGNGFFKPNISTIVGSLYPEGSKRRDSGFTIFYIGINLGAAMSPLLCGYIGETYGWHYGFGLATFGMLLGLAVFVNWIPPGKVSAPPSPEKLAERPVIVTQAMLLIGALTAAIGLFVFLPNNPFSIAVNIFVGIALLGAGVVSCLALRGAKGGLINVEWAIYLATIVLIPVVVLLVSGFSLFTNDKRPISLVPESVVNDYRTSEVFHVQVNDVRKIIDKKRTKRIEDAEKSVDALAEEGRISEDHQKGLKKVLATASKEDWDAAKTELDELARQHPPEPFNTIIGVVLQEVSKPAGLILLIGGLAAFGYLIFESFRLEKIARERMFVVLILTFFSMLFWAFFEQAGSSVNNFTDRNVDRVFETKTITSEDVGKTIEIQPTQEQVGYQNGEKLFTIDQLDKTRDKYKENNVTDFKISWKVAPDNVGMGIASRNNEIPASWFQSINPVYILIFGLVFTALWSVLASVGMEPSTPVKFALGLAQLGLGFGAFWYGAETADSRGMVALAWLFLGYLLQTTGELCLSPVGLSMVTKLSPMRLVSTVMGGWFLATAFSQFLAAIIAQFTGVTHGGDGGGAIPPPVETVDVYGGVFKTIAVTALISAAICLGLSPLLTRWMHEKKTEESKPFSPADPDIDTSIEEDKY